VRHLVTQILRPAAELASQGKSPVLLRPARICICLFMFWSAESFQLSISLCASYPSEAIAHSSQVLEDERLVKADTEKAAELAAVEAAEVHDRPLCPRSRAELSPCCIDAGLQAQAASITADNPAQLPDVASRSERSCPCTRQAERMRAAVAARLARRPPKAEPAAAPVEREDDDGDEEVTDATFDERMRAKVPHWILHARACK